MAFGRKLLFIIALVVIVAVALATAVFYISSSRNPVLGTWLCGEAVINNEKYEVKLIFEEGGRVIASFDTLFLGNKTTITGEGRYNVSGDKVEMTIRFEFFLWKFELSFRGRVEGDRLAITGGVRALSAIESPNYVIDW